MFKLIRDNIPNIVKANGEVVDYAIVQNDGFFKALLKNKLIEEVNEYLNSDVAIIKMVNWTIKDKPQGPIKVGVKFRYRQKDQGCTLEFIDEETVKLIYDAPYKAVTPGQAAVFYINEACVGGGIIDNIYYKGKEKMVYNYEGNK